MTTFLSAQYLVTQRLDCFSWIYDWDITKNKLDLGDRDIIFKITTIEKLKIHGWGTSVFYENTVTGFLMFLYLLEVPYRGTSNECPQHMFLQRRKKKKTILFD